jgi:hypothetical protein
MTLRTTSKVITFVHPFALPGLDHAQPSRAYTVQTDEEPIEGLSLPSISSRRNLDLSASAPWAIRFLSGDLCCAGRT